MENCGDIAQASLSYWVDIWVLFYERGVSRKNFSHAGGMRAYLDRQPPDRWHLLKNLSEALERLLTRKHRLAARAAQGVIVEVPPPATLPVQEPSLPAAPTRAERERARRRE